MKLEEASEYETDALLVQLVRLQHLTEMIFQINTRDQIVDTLPGIPETPVIAYHTAFQKELDRLRDSLPPSLKNNCKQSLSTMTKQTRR